MAECQFERSREQIITSRLRSMSQNINRHTILIYTLKQPYFIE